MALARTERLTSLDWPPDILRRFFDQDRNRSSWLRVEEYRHQDELVLRAEIPDIDPEKDIEVTVSDGTLRIHAERQQTTEAPEKTGYRSEFRYGSFTREFILPDRAKADEVKATYDKGILEVRIPLPAAKQPSVTSIPVTTG